MFEEANKRIGFLFPPVKITLELLRERPDLKAQKIKPGDELPVIAWIWTRTVKCPNPACEIQAPLVNKFWASTHNGNEVWINSTLRDGSKAFEFDVVVGRGQPQEGTVKRSGALCLACKTPIPFSYIRQQGIDGKIDFQLMCLVADGSSKRVYIPPRCAPTAVSLENLHPEWVPETTLPGKALGFRVQKYGITKHQDFFTKRQLVTLSTFCKLLVEVEKEILRDSKGDLEYAQAIITYLSLAINRLAQTNNSLIRWLIRRSGTSKGTPAFDRPIVPMAWEFSEGNVFLESVGSWNSAIKNMLSAFSVFVSNQPLGKAFQASASEVIKTVLPVVSTDPPYFDNIGYGDLSDFFYIWLRKNLSRIYPELFATMLVPKHQEIVMAPDRFDGDANDAEKHFMEGLKSAFKLICNAANPDYPVTFYYAFKQAEEIEDYLGISPTNSMAVPSTGWESMLEALVQANFVITGTWPVRTEAISRLRAIGANALASSIVLVCRPRPAVASTATRRDFIAALRQELPSALRQLQQGSIAPVDLAQAAIGPGMAIFSSYKQVLEADGTPMRVRTALALLNQALDEFLAEQEGEYDGDTRWALAWYEQYGHEQGPYGVAETLSKAKNTSVEGLVEAGFLEARAGKVRLLRRDELDPEWDPQKDKRPTAWEACQHLIYILEKGGEQAAAALLAKLGSLSETARDLAYRLYTVCERKGRAQDALGYNMLVVAWPRIKDQANKQSRQEKLF
jgi:putative DNA methylase